MNKVIGPFYATVRIVLIIMLAQVKINVKVEHVLGPSTIVLHHVRNVMEMEIVVTSVNAKYMVCEISFTSVYR